MSELYPPMTPPYGFRLKREHFTYHEMNGSPWAQCAKHDDIYHDCLDSGGFAIGDDCVGCVVEDRIIKLLEERKCGCYCEVHMVLDPAIAAIKGEK